mgnify:FL=1
MNTKFTMPSGMTFDFTNMFGEGRLSLEAFEKAMATEGVAACEAVKKTAETGVSKGHLSKDGTPEHVFFHRMPYPAENNPNTPESIEKLKAFGKYMREMDAVVFLGVGGSYLGNKVLVDALGGFFWNSDDARRNGQVKLCMRLSVNL